MRKFLDFLVDNGLWFTFAGCDHHVYMKASEFCVHAFMIYSNMDNEFWDEFDYIVYENEFKVILVFKD